MTPHPLRFGNPAPYTQQPTVGLRHAAAPGKWIAWSIPVLLAVVGACDEREPGNGITPPGVDPHDVPSTIARDDFDRTSSSGWGSAEIGGKWLYNTSDVSTFRVHASEGAIIASSTTPRAAYLQDVRAKNTAGVVAFRIDKAPDNSSRFHTIQLYARRNSAAIEDSYYRFRVRAFGHGQMDLRVEKRIGGVAGWVSNEVTIPARWQPGARYWVRWECIGASPATVIRLKVWSDGTAEPVEWQIATVVDEPQLDVAGTVGLHVAPPSVDQVTYPITYAFDSLRVTVPGHRNALPVARLAVTPGIQANVAHAFDGTGSSDPDGHVPLAYHWDFGDGTTRSGPTPSHTFMDHGRFIVSLIVIDSGGVPSAPATAEVEVGARPADLLIRDDFSRTLANEWGMADAGGQWRRSAATPGLFSTNGRQGLIAAPAGTTHNIVATEIRGMNGAGLISFSVDVMPTQATRYHMVQVYARRDDRVGDGNDYYRYRVRLYGSGGMDAQIETSIQSVGGNVTGNVGIPFQWKAGQRFWFRWEAIGTSPATHVAMKVWPDGTREPVEWQVAVMVDEPRLDVVGTTGVRVHAASELGAPVATFAFDDLLYRLKQ